MRYVSIIILLVALAGQAGFGQNAKESLFGDVEKMLNEAKEKNAELLSPEYYRQAVEAFNEANQYYMKNESTRDIREKLAEAQKYCQRALQAVKLAGITLKEPIQAREDALNVEANIYATQVFTEAEEKFAEATGQVEDDDLEDARDRGSEAEALYRKAELKAIKDKLLGDARKLIQEAREKDVEEFAPQTFNLAVSLLSELEDMLTYNRYAGNEAALKAKECVYQARHAMFLAEKIRALRENEQNWEKLILEYEDVLTGFASKFDEKPQFDEGMKDAITLINTRIENLVSEHKQLLEDNAKLQEAYDALQEEASSSSAELAKERERDEKFNKVKELFTPQEAKVLIDGNNLVIRLHGLNFPSGSSVIQPEYFSLLTKVQEALKIFPDRHILLEGHTDSRGNAKTNKSLSEERAIAVREYIIANMGKPHDQITAIGYGAAKPVATNDTPEGRELNRRIDVVINLSE
jgi:outer membrane protein OmpA-like peptidoglycan-associated protein